ncbi:ABC transporter permease subunit [Actinoallomurus spadix]|uniref:ABC transporter permease n=1 Tax=Actinoallomurus spadix TaxID=79912 RepID=A0ABP3FZN3_9ACTN|nr:ABC transporter permease subunit [Actinoallomurus spadix]MCO5989290.1 ABC transporter permease subunit [Actinoallomurus spadix]
MRLLRAELRKLNRPLLYGVAFAATLFCVLLAVGAASNTASDVAGAGRVPSSCAELRMPEGSACEATKVSGRARAALDRERELRTAKRTAAHLGPAAGGAEAAGLMASLPGVLAIALLAGGHVGGEWSGRTLKTVLTHCGRRERVLAAKLVSLWLAGAGLIAACWAALAVAGPILVRAYDLPSPHVSVAGELRHSAGQFGRALAVIAVFAVIGLLAAVVTRGSIGTMAATAGIFITVLALAGLPGTGRWTPATWVQEWMGFAAGLGSITRLPDNFWSRFIPATGSPPGPSAGLIGLAATFVAGALLAVALFRRSDVSQ